MLSNREEVSENTEVYLSQTKLCVFLSTAEKAVKKSGHWEHLLLRAAQNGAFKVSHWYLVESRSAVFFFIGLLLFYFVNLTDKYKRIQKMFKKNEKTLFREKQKGHQSFPFVVLVWREKRRDNFFFFFCLCHLPKCLPFTFPFSRLPEMQKVN